MKLLYSVLKLWRPEAVVVALVIAALGLSAVRDAGPVLADAGPNLTPASVNATLFPGESVDIEKTVHTPVIPPLVDICLAEDETGSFFDDIANLAALAPGLVTALDASGSNYATCVVGFRDFARNGWGASGDWVYRRLSDVAPGGASLLAGVAALTAGGGADVPEAQLEALHYLATPLHPAIDSNGDADTIDINDTPAGQQPTWRIGSQRIVLLATDAECHATGDAGGWPGDAGTTTAAVTAGLLSAANITVIGLTPGGAGTIACVDTLAAGTGGSVQATTDTGAEIVTAILAGLSAVSVNVSMASDCTAPISTTFAPPAQVVVSGGHAVFTETISVAASAPGGTYVCRDWALINGVAMTDAAGNIIYETKTIKVPENFLTGGGNIVDGNGKDAERITWGGNVGRLADASLVGQWQTNFHNVEGDTLDGATFHSTAITSLLFHKDAGPGPNPPEAEANVAIFTATGRLNNADGYMLWVCLADRGEPGRQHDSIQFKLTAPDGVTVLYNSQTDFASEDVSEGCDRHKLDGGNMQIHSGLKAS